MAALLLGAVLYLVGSGEKPGATVSTREDVGRLAEDAVRVLARVAIDDARYDDRYLDMALAAGLAGDPSYIEAKLSKILPTGSQYNVYLDNLHRTHLVAGSRTATGERVSSATSFAPAWSPSYATTDFGLYSTLPGTPMRVTTYPVHHGRLLADGSYVPGGDMEEDADGDGVPDPWAADAAATATLVADGSTAWKLDRAAAGRVAYATEPVLADAGTGFDVSAEVRGGRACVQFRYLDASFAEVEVDGVAEECVASLAVASPGAYETVTGQKFLDGSSSVAYVQVELALVDAGTSWFDDVVVRPLPKATTSNDVVLPLPRTAASTYAGEQSAGGYATGPSETLSVEVRWRGQPVTADVAYATTAEPLLPVVWTSAVAGLDASSLDASASTVPIGEDVVLDYDFAPYAAALAADGVTLDDPQVRVRVYGPVVAPEGGVVLLEELDAPAATLTGSLAYEHPEDGLYGPLLVEASLESGWSKAGYTSVAGQSANKAVLVEARLKDGSAAVPPLYRVVVETWFPEW